MGQLPLRVRLLRDIPGIGDILRCTAVATSIRKIHPDAIVDIVTTAELGWYMNTCPDINKVITVPLPRSLPWNKGFPPSADHDCTIDLVCPAFTYEKSCWPDIKKDRIEIWTEEASRVLGETLEPCKPVVKLEPRHYAAGTDVMLRYGFLPKGDRQLKVVGLIPGSGQGRRRFSDDQMAEITRYLRSARLQVFQIPDEVRGVDFWGVFTQLDFFITPDTGPMHMAGCLDVPTLCVCSVAEGQFLTKWYPSVKYIDVDYKQLPCVGPCYHIAGSCPTWQCPSLSRMPAHWIVGNALELIQEENNGRRPQAQSDPGRLPGVRSQEDRPAEPEDGRPVHRVLSVPEVQADLADRRLPRSRGLLMEAVKVAAVYCKESDNVGDITSSPAHYFDFGACKHYELLALRYHNLPEESVVILGGGGLCYENFETDIRPLVEERKVIGWGIGLDNHTLMPDEYPEWISKLAMVGVRDWSQDISYYWVPCASCMSPAFDKPREITRRWVIYNHIQQDLPLRKLPGTAVIDNATYHDLDSILDFLGSAEYVLTNSYHGAYWATLLGRKVVAWAWSSKFMHMKHTPLLVGGPEFLGVYKDKARTYPEALEECRDANRKFYEKVKAFLLRG